MICQSAPYCITVSAFLRGISSRDGQLDHCQWSEARGDRGECFVVKFKFESGASPESIFSTDLCWLVIRIIRDSFRSPTMNSNAAKAVLLLV